MAQQCPVCESVAELCSERFTYHPFRGTTVGVRSLRQFYYCGPCDEQFVPAELSKENQRHLAEAMQRNQTARG